MIAGTIRKQHEPVRYLAVVLATLAVLATGIVGGVLAAGATSQPSVSSQTLPAPATSDHLQPSGPR
jgi:hypothetical protein